MRTLLLSSALVLTACCTSKEAAVEVTPASKKVLAPDTVKPGAPSTLESKVDGQTARLTLRFDGAGEQVSVSVRGIDGATVSGTTELLSGATVKAGDVREFPVSFTVSGRGHLVVSVDGTFAGAPRSRVHTVAVGEGVAKDLGTVQTTNDGDTVKVLP